MPIVLISGKRCSGKDTVANMVSKLMGNTRIVALADAVKEEVAECYNLDVHRLMNDREYKEQHRDKLIARGCQRRDEDVGYWASKVYASHVERRDHILVVPDARFVDEVQYFLDQRGALVLVWRVECNVRDQRGWTPNEAVDTHPTETQLDSYPYFDMTIHNNGDLRQLRKEVETALVPLRIHRDPTNTQCLTVPLSRNVD